MGIRWVVACALSCLFGATGCGGGGGGGAAVPATAPPPVFEDGLGISGVSASAIKVYDSGREDNSTPEIALAGSGDVVLAWWTQDLGAMWIRGQGQAWSAPAQLAAAANPRLSVSGNNAGNVAARWSVGRLFQFHPQTGWRPAATDQSPDTMASDLSPVHTLSDGTSAYTMRGMPSPPNGNFETHLMLVSPSGRVEKHVFPDYARSNVIATKGVWGLLHAEQVVPGSSPWAMQWRAFNTDLTTANVVTIAETPNYCRMGPIGYAYGPLFGAMSEAGFGVAAATLSRGGYQDAATSYIGCELIAAPIHRAGAAATQTLTSLTGQLVDVPVVGAGGNLAIVLWREASRGSLSPSAWFASTSVAGGSFSSPAGFGPPLPNKSWPAVVVDSTGRATVAVTASFRSLQSLNRIYVANYTVSGGWTPWRQVFAGFAAGPPKLAVNDVGDVALAFTATPCDRTAAVPEAVCSSRKTAAIFVIKNP